MEYKAMRIAAVLVFFMALQGCTAMVVGSAVGAVTTVAVETVKVPFKVAGAAVDLVTDDEDDDKEKDEDD